MDDLSGTIDDNLALADDATGLEHPSLSLNLTAVDDWSPQMPFLDIMKMSRPWIGHEPGQWGGTSYDDLAQSGVLDDAGWPMAIPDGLDRIGTIWAWNNQPDAAESREGVYVLTYEGEGTLDLNFDANVLSAEPGRIVFENTEGGQFVLDILATDPNGTGDYIRDISIVREDHVELHEAGAVFNPEWVELINDAGQLRFMNWMETNGSTLSAWEDRPETADVTWAKDGIPVEVMVQLANEAGADPWFTMPHGASEEYIREFATYVRDNLDPSLKAMVEYSNEAWNWAFQQTNDIADAAQAEWGAAGGMAQAGYYAKLATESALIWDDVFATEADARVVNVLAGQTVNSWFTDQIIKAELWFENEPEDAVSPADVFDAFAVTTYFGSATIADPLLRAELISAIEDPTVDATAWLAGKLMDPAYKQSIPDIAEHLAEQKAVVSDHGLDLIAYEGGQHVHHSFAVSGLTQPEINALQDFLSDFVRSEEMADLYEELWAVWEAVGDGPFMQYEDVSTVSKFGSWGLRAGLDDTTPRAERLDELNAATPAWWDDERGGDTFQQGSVQEGTSDADTLIGTTKNDYLIGGAGSDVFAGGAGDDGIHGGTGHDILQLNGAPGEYWIAPAGEGFVLTGPDGRDFLISVEELMFASGHRLVLDDIPPEGTSIDKLLLPGPGDDTLQFDDRGMLLDGAEGTDHATFEIGEEGVAIYAINTWSTLGRELALTGQGTPGYVAAEIGTEVEIDGQAVSVSYWSLEENRAEQSGSFLNATALQTTLLLGSVVTNTEIIEGSSGNDRLYGRGADDHFLGAAGDDLLLGGGGEDILEGGAGRDRLFGGKGADDLWGGGGIDTFVFKPGEGIDVVHDLEAGDVLDLRGLGFSDREAVVAALTPDEDGVHFLDFGEGNGLVLLGLSDASLEDVDIIV